MGQYFIIVNLDKKEFIHPHAFKDGLKLLEFGYSGRGTMTALALLLRKSSETGGGDWRPHAGDGKNHSVGSWAGDSIVVIGDYDESGLYQDASDTYKDVSEQILKAF